MECPALRLRGIFLGLQVVFCIIIGMEMNYDINYWGQNKCPKVGCRKNDRKCGLKYVNIPLGLSEEFAPTNGAYCNTIVEYEDTGAVYIYSSEGIPVLVKEGNAS